MFVHGMAEQANPIWHISPDEAKSLAKALQLFQKEFDVPISDRAVAVSALGSAMFFIYGTRLSALWMDAQARRAGKPAGSKSAAAANVPLKTHASQPPPAGPEPAPTRADVMGMAEGFVNGAASYKPNGIGPSPEGAHLVDPASIAAAIANLIPRKPQE